ncbi:hypothetical protein C7B67_03765 [filamentous cyanobacterium Phorm 6]|nr:hypothetical protein C7B67_03765 [filamentous cyanobacterium Phorm 6]
MNPPFRGGGVWLPLRGDMVVSESLSGNVSLVNVIKACYAGSTVSVTLRLFNYQRQSRGLASYPRVS